MQVRKMKSSFIIIFIISLFAALLIVNDSNNITLFSERTYRSITEHTDIKINGVSFNILHYMSDKNSRLIISETLSGIAIRTSLNGYLLIPTHKYKTSNLGSFQSIGAVLSLCSYHVSNNNIIFFDGSRGLLENNNQLIPLPTIFLGQKSHSRHPNNIDEEGYTESNNEENSNYQGLTTITY
ncbi:TPA: PsaF/MyfF family fimbrial adhesin regulatory protein [Escherichia coli]